MRGPSKRQTEQKLSKGDLRYMQKSMIEVVYLMLVQKLLELESPDDRGQQISQLFACPHDPMILTHSYDLDSESSYPA